MIDCIFCENWDRAKCLMAEPHYPDGVQECEHFYREPGSDDETTEGNKNGKERI